MRKIYLAAMIMTALVSCQITNPYSREVTANDLLDYSNAQMGRCVTLPAELMDVLTGLEDYLNKSDEEKIYDRKYYGMVSDYGSGVYGLSRRVNGLNCIVDTKGTSLWEEGAEWEFSGIGYYGDYADNKIYIHHDINFAEVAVLKMENPSDSIWTFHADNVTSRIKMMVSDSLKVWNVEGYCKNTGEGEYHSVSTTGEGGMTVRKVWRDAGSAYPYQEISYSGSFATDIYKGDRKADFCTVTFRPGFSSSYSTSR